MPDDIYDYFSGNKARKVEPIEDDDDSGEFDDNLGKTEAADDSAAENPPQDSDCLLYTSPSPRDRG